MRTNGVGAFATVSPRQQITSTPYAIRSANVANGAITSASIADGAITASKIAPGAISQLGASDGSPTNALQVDPNGLVGIGTGTNPPAAGLQVLSGASFLTPVALFQVTDGTGSFTNLGGAGYLNSDIKGNLVAIPSQVNAVSLIDVTDLTAPVMRSQIVNGVGAFTNMDFPTGVAFGNNVLAIAAESSSAVTLVSVTNPAVPVKLAELTDGVAPWNDLGGAGSVAISANNVMAIAAQSDNAVTLVDISNPGVPQLKVVLKQGQFGYTNLYGVTDIAIFGNLMAFCSLYSNSVTLVDITDPSSPIKRAELVDGVNGFNNIQGPITVTFSGNLLAIAGALDHSVTLVNVSNPSNPTLLSVITNFDTLFGGSGIPAGVTFSGNQMAVSGNGVALFDISTPSSPRLIALARDNEGGLNHLSSIFSPLFAGTNIVVSGESALTILGFTNAQAGISTAGWVGIGTTLPSAPLTVVGNVSVRDADQFSVSAQHVQFGSGDASGTLATAFGELTHASGPNSTAMGSFTTASGDSSTAMGSGTKALGDLSVAMGQNSTASGILSMTMGYGALASADYAIAFGFQPSATNFAAFAVGADPIAGGSASFVGGEFNVGTGEAAVALGNTTVAGGDFSVALNNHTIAGGQSSVALGDHSTAGGFASFAAGNLAQANNNNTFVWADGTTSSPFSSTADNQFLIRAAAVGIGTNNPAAKLHVAGNAIFTGAAVLGGLTTMGTTTNTALSNGTLVPVSSYVVLNASSPVSLNAITAIADGAPPGTLLILRGTSDVNTVTINDNANTALGANRVLGLNDTLTLVYNGDVWVELAYANN